MRRTTSPIVLALATLILLVTGCAAASDSNSSDSNSDASAGDDLTGSESGPEANGGGGIDGPLVIGAIPDQDPELLARNYGLLADYLAEELGIEVTYEPVTEYAAAVTAFRVGDLDLVWFGGLTGVQARLQVDGAEALAQRDIDAEFTSVFIAGVATGIEPIQQVEDLSVLRGHTLTFGSDSSTSGRLMPQSFLSQAGVSLDDLDGEPGFSGSHDATIALVESGTFEVGALNSQVWHSRLEAGEIDTDKVRLIFETPPYYDYHWVARPELGDGLKTDIVAALSTLDPGDPDEAAILDFFGAGSFIETADDNYSSIEEVGRETGLIES